MRRVVVLTWVWLMILSSTAILGCRSRSADEVETRRRASAVSNPPYIPFGGEYDELIATHSDKCLTVKDVSTSDGAEIVQWVCNGGENQRWQLRAHGASYEIVAKHSGKCLTVLNASTADGALMIQWGCNQATHQLFSVQSAGAGLRLTAVHSGKVVDVAARSHFDGAGVLQWPWGSQTNQIFATRRRNDRNGAVGLQVLSGTATGFSVGTTRVMDAAFNTAAGSYPGLLIGDFQGDGKPEIVQQWDNDGTLRLRTYAWDGQGYASAGGWSSGAGYASAVGARPRLIVADVTGDGKADLVQQWDFGGWLLLYAYAWNGTQMAGLGPWSQTYNGYASGVGYQPGLMAANVDGGAKTELVQQWNNGGLLSLYAYQWNGSQFVGMGSWTHTAHGYASGAGGHPGLIAADIDGAADGKTEIIQQWDNNGILWLYAYRWDGSQFAPAGQWTNTLHGYATAGASPGLFVADVNGDGKAELIQQFNWSGTLWLYPYTWNGSQFVGLGQWTNTQTLYATAHDGTPGLLAVKGAGSSRDLVQQWNVDGTLWLRRYSWNGVTFSSSDWTIAGPYSTGADGGPGLEVLPDLNGDGREELLQQWNHRGGTICASCFNVWVGIPIRVHGPDEKMDNPVNMFNLGGSVRGYFASKETYRLEGTQADTVVPILSPPALTYTPNTGAYDEDGVWLNTVYPGAGKLQGWYYSEKDALTATHEFTVSYAESTNQGLTYSKSSHPNNVVIKAAFPFTAPAGHGEGNHGIIWDNASLYMYFMQARNPPDGWWTAVATAPIGLGGPGTWYKYFNGSFSQPGYGGEATPLEYGTPITHGNPANPVPPTTKMAGFTPARYTGAAGSSHVLPNQVVLFFVDQWFGGLRTIFGGIPTGPFVDLPDPLVPVEDWSWSLPKATELIGYPSAVALDGRGQFSDHFVLFTMYVKPEAYWSDRNLLRRHVWWQYTGTPQPYNVRIRLARYWSAAQADRWDTTAYPIELFIETGYSFVKDLGELLTRDVPGLGLIPLYDCYLFSSADHKTSTSASCESGYAKRRRLGWIFSSPQWNTRPLYQCWDGVNTDYFVSESASCEGRTYQGVLGHILSPGA